MMEKLKSRKLWAAIIAGIVGFMKAYYPEFPNEALYTVLGAAAAYIAGEAYVDGQQGRG